MLKYLFLFSSSKDIISITVNLKQLSRVTNEISGIPYNKLKQTSFEKLFLDNISNLVCGIYQKVLNFI